MTKTYKDQQGNKYRKSNGGWEIMRKGIGWQAFESTAYIHVCSEEEDALETLVIEPTPQTDPPEVAEEKQVRKVREDELFVHFVDSWQREALNGAFDKLEAGEVECFQRILSKTSCDYAQAMIDELKERGRL